jgi:hypothetical protein
MQLSLSFHLLILCTVTISLIPKLSREIVQLFEQKLFLTPDTLIMYNQANESLVFHLKGEDLFRFKFMMPECGYLCFDFE